MPLCAADIAHRPWHLDLTNGFHLTDEMGRPVSLGQRKCQELFLALALRRGRLADRDAVAADLWPVDAPSERRSNLRQTLSKLRRALGSGRIYADRTVCGFEKGFVVRVDRGVPTVEGDSSAQTPVGGFLRFLQWQSENEPDRVLGTMSANPSLTHSLPPFVFKDLLERGAANAWMSDADRRWKLFWDGCAASQVANLGAALPRMKRALQSGIEARDSSLVIEAGISWAGGEVLKGRAMRGLEILDLVESVAGPQNRRAARQLCIVRSSAFLHLGRRDAWRDLLQRQEHLESALDYASQRALEAFFVATSPDPAQTMDLVEGPLAQAREIGASSLETLCLLAVGYAEARENPERAIGRLTELRRYCQRSGFAHFALYASEALALAMHRADELRLAAKESSAAAGTRARLAFGLTSWDRDRLAPVAHLL